MLFRSNITASCRQSPARHPCHSRFCAEDGGTRSPTQSTWTCPIPLTPSADETSCSDSRAISGPSPSRAAWRYRPPGAVLRRDARSSKRYETFNPPPLNDRPATPACQPSETNPWRDVRAARGRRMAPPGHQLNSTRRGGVASTSLRGQWNCDVPYVSVGERPLYSYLDGLRRRFTRNRHTAARCS